MIKSQLKSAKKQQQNEKQISFILQITQAQILDEKFNQKCYLNIKNEKIGQEWMSPEFKKKMNQIWTTPVEGPNLLMQLIVSGPQYKILAEFPLQQGTDLIHLASRDNKQNKICSVRYELKRTAPKTNEPKGNHFYYDTNIFDSFLDNNEISRVYPVKKKKQVKVSDITFERVGFAGNATQILQDSQLSQRTQQKQLQTKATRRNMHNVTYERHRFQFQANDTLNVSLNDSQSDIKQIMEVIQPNEQSHKQSLQQIHQKVQSEQQQYITTAQKWYKNKFNKKYNKLLRKKTMPAQVSDEQIQQPPQKNIEILAYNAQACQKEQVIRQLTDMSVENSLRLKTIDFSLSSDGETKRMYRLSRNDGKDSSLWYTTVSFPSQGTIIIQCDSQNGQLNGCLGAQQIKKGQCPLYDEGGRINGTFSFKTKSICNFPVQTHQLLCNGNASNTSFPNQNNQTPIPQHQQKKPKEVNHQMDQNEEVRQKQEALEQKQERINGNENPETSKQVEQDNKKWLSQNIQHHQSFQIQESEAERQRQRQNNQLKTPIQSLREWRKSRYAISPPIHQQSQKNEEKSESIEPLSALKQLADSIHPTLKSTVEKQYEKNRMNTIKEKMKKFSTIDVKIASLSPNQTQQQNSPMLAQKNSLKISKNNYYFEQDEQTQRQRKRFYSYNSNKLESIQHSNDNSQIYNNENNRENTESSHNSFSYRLNKQKASIRQSQSNTSRAINYHPILHRVEPKDQMDESLFNYEDQYKKRNQSDFKISNAKKKNLINLKISNIKLTLHKPIYNPKLIKMQIGQKYFFTQYKKDFCYINWKGNGYFFLKISEYSILYIDLIQQEDGQQFSIGRCKIHLPFLTCNQSNKTYEHIDFIRAQNEQSLGRIEINYQIIQKRGKSLQKKNQYHRLETIKYTQRQYSLRNQNQDKKIPSKKNKRNQTRLSTEGSVLFGSKRIPTNIGKSLFNSEQFVFSRFKGRPPLAKRKYTGGNNLFPKASRFKEDKQVNKFVQGPGPGAYEVQSTFDRHATRL